MTTIETTTTATFTIPRDLAIAIATNCNLRTAPHWDDARLAAKLPQIVLGRTGEAIRETSDGEALAAVMRVVADGDAALVVSGDIECAAISEWTANVVTFIEDMDEHEELFAAEIAGIRSTEQPEQPAEAAASECVSPEAESAPGCSPSPADSPVTDKDGWLRITTRDEDALPDDVLELADLHGVTIHTRSGWWQIRRDGSDSGHNIRRKAVVEWIRSRPIAATVTVPDESSLDRLREEAENAGQSHESGPASAALAIGAPPPELEPRPYIVPPSRPTEDELRAEDELRGTDDASSIEDQLSLHPHYVGTGRMQEDMEDTLREYTDTGETDFVADEFVRSYRETPVMDAWWSLIDRLELATQLVLNARHAVATFEQAAKAVRAEVSATQRESVEKITEKSLAELVERDSSVLAAEARAEDARRALSCARRAEMLIYEQRRLIQAQVSLITAETSTGLQYDPASGGHDELG
jgi:hypothetical protein